MSAILIKEIKKSFPGVQALKSVSLTINNGEFFFLLGPSGCGKSTLLRIIAGLDEPDEGQIEIDGVDVTDRRPQDRNIGMVFQSYALWPHMTVFENINFGLEIKSISSSKRNEMVRNVLDIVRMADFASRYPGELSGGQQQRVALARALVLEPNVILLDEPMSNLDTKLRLELRRELRRIHRETQTTMIFVTHDQSEALSLGTTIALMKDGEIQQMGAPEVILNNPANEFVRNFLAGTSLMPATIVSSKGGLTYVKTNAVEIGLSGQSTLSPGDSTMLSVQASLVSN
ncbi:MAG: ABC transporter ATP-binding protein [SAR324 cluster bacterium]|uniref:ABC transporter ATP-binding protein n=1 Tax=SAR324 cluster bacterium TaxID=2024889 RepID=A0A7X9FQG4_9DELT|nr:ABC transporter ATP-binding protein [SAR324 cluster bacterium]